MITKKKAQMPAFNWLFAIIIGVVILFLAVYFVGKFVKTSTYRTSAELVSSFDILLNPFASIGGIGKTTLSKTIKLPVETIAEFSCSDVELGKQGLRIKSKGSFSKWSDFTKEHNIYDKYIFSSNLKGKNFYVLSKPFELPFRIDDLIYVISQDYCFIGAPEELKEELGEMNIPAIKFDDVDGCDEKCKADTGCKTVCFEGSGCDIDIIEYSACEGAFCETVYEYGSVTKKDNDDNGKIKELSFATDALLYAAIFSDSGTYKCNFNRLMHRLDLLGDVYSKKAKELGKRGCNMENIDSDISKLQDESEKEKPDVEVLYNLARTLADRNAGLDCQVF